MKAKSIPCASVIVNSPETIHYTVTTVSAGALALAHDSHNNLATSPNLIVASGATLHVTGLTGGRLDLAPGQTLKGGGTIVGTLGVASGATVAPGASPGILYSGSAVFSSGSTFAVEIEGAAIGTGHDQLAVPGTVDLGGATLALSGSYTPAPARRRFTRSSAVPRVCGTRSGTVSR